MKDKELVWSVTKDDFIWEWFCAGGHGGQNMQKNRTACRCTLKYDHNATGISRDERSKAQNTKKAWRRCIETDAFKRWYKIENAKRMGRIISIEDEVNKAMRDENLKIEKLVNGKWVPYEEEA